jgi:DNA-binding transcriptional regulator YdaS (Cro superfamily)
MTDDEVKLSKSLLKALIDYHGSQTKLSKMFLELGIPIYQANISNWICRDSSIPAHICPYLERFSGYRIKKEMLRPDVYKKV